MFQPNEVINEVIKDNGYMDGILAVVARGFQLTHEVRHEVLCIEMRASRVVDRDDPRLAAALSNLGRVAALRDCDMLYLPEGYNPPVEA